MKNRIYMLLFTALTLAGCADFLDRPQLTSYVDDTFWVSEGNLRMYAQEFYPYFFTGYGTGTSEYVPMIGYYFSDDLVYDGPQTDFEMVVPSSRGADALTTSTTANAWLSLYNGPTWHFMWIRKANIMLDRMNDRMGSVLDQEQRRHWEGIARFFRAMEYARLAATFGNVPYYNHEVVSDDFDQLYKSRTTRNEVMDSVYSDLYFAMRNVRVNDGDQMVNRDIVSAFAARFFLFEGTWQKYHNNNTERATKFLSAAIEMTDNVRMSGKYDIVTDFKTLFTSKNLIGNKDCILYRHYDASVGVTHNIATNNNLNESLKRNPNLSLLKSFICTDGLAAQESSVDNAGSMDLTNLIKTRDSRLEASIYNEPYKFANGSLLYAIKFLSREGESHKGASSLPLEYKSINNVTDYPVMRYSEVLLNWIEAKAELATLGGVPVSQDDINLSINKIRSRPLDEVAKAKGVNQTAPMSLTRLPKDLSRDADVSPLIWEIRRERRMEFAFEHSRLLDLKRWKKIQYMDPVEHPELLLGAWVDFNSPVLSEMLSKGTIVVDESGTEVVYDGTNQSKMIGYYKGQNTTGRKPFIDVPGVNPYLAPVGYNQRAQYRAAGERMGKKYELEQTEGWSDYVPD